MEEVLYEITPMRQFARLMLSAPTPADTTIMNFRHLPVRHQLAAENLQVINGYLQNKDLSLHQGTIGDAMIIHAPSSTKNKDSQRDPEMSQTKTGNQCYFGMKVHIGADVESAWFTTFKAQQPMLRKLLRRLNCCMARRTQCMAMPIIPALRSDEHADRAVIWPVATRCSTYTCLLKRNLIYKDKRRIKRAKAQI